MMGTLRRNDNKEAHLPFWARTLAGIVTAAIVGIGGGGTGGWIAAQIILERHSVKIEELEKRQSEDRFNNKEAFHELRSNLRELEIKK